MNKLACSVIASALTIIGLGAISTVSPAYADDTTKDCADGEVLDTDGECAASTTTRSSESTATSDSSSQSSESTIAPTFTADLDADRDLGSLWLGKNLFIVGNNLNTSVDASTGLLFVAGNDLTLRTSAEYGFVAGNIINFAGSTSRDLFAAGNVITLDSDAEIGRNVFLAAASVTVKTDLPGDLAATAGSITLKNTHISGNLDLAAEEIHFEGNVIIDGAFTYNDDATVTGMNSNGVKISHTASYHLEEADASVVILAELYAKFFSIVGLCLVTLLICALSTKMHRLVAESATPGDFGKHLALGLAILIGTPIVIALAFCTVIAAPLALILLALYIIAIYLSQGVAGIWLGHLIIEKLCKAKSNIYLEALLGIVILGVLSLVPYIGALSGFLGLLLGLGLMAVGLIDGCRSQDSVSASEGSTRPLPAKSTKSKTSAPKTEK